MEREEYKARLGTRFTCHVCGLKFYDLNRPAATCPECGTDPATAPARDIKALLGSGKSRRKATMSEEPSFDAGLDDEDDEDRSLDLMDDDEDEGGGDDEEEDDLFDDEED